MSTIKKLRCAVYTRKSSEEGLEQEFNSLDAQWEACVAFIASQVGLGWKLIPEHYDDGGISGGTLERPALQRLLRDIEDRKIDVVVVYKIDRLTRSLMDFSRIVEIFDKQSVSFVSITQQFNTTTSMGRLTLNVLLSFAQFEREVTGERIRDKIAASKKKGMWMGGVVPLGYDVQDRKLRIDAQEADTVRHLFRRYLELRSVRNLATEVETRALYRAERRGTSGKPFGRGNLYHLLSNPIYIGKIRHKADIHDGEHPTIIDPEVFEQVQRLLAKQKQQRSFPTNRSDVHLLTGIAFDETGDRLSPSHASKQGKRYRYYVSARMISDKQKHDGGWRIPAAELDGIVMAAFKRLLGDKAALAGTLQSTGHQQAIGRALARCDALLKSTGPAELHSDRLRQALRAVFNRVDLSSDSITITWDRERLIGLLVERDDGASKNVTDWLASAETIVLPVTLKRRGVETRLVLTDGSAPTSRPDETLIRLIAKAHCYLKSLTDGSGRSHTDVAGLYKIEPSEILRVLPLAFLPPSITEAILAGRQSPSLTARRLLRMPDLPLVWADQIDCLL